MKFSSREDIEAPIDYVFDQVTDFPVFERAAVRRGADVTRHGDDAAAKVGTSWSIAFKFRGKRRDVDAKLTHLDVPNGFTAETVSGGLQGQVQIELVPLSPNRTRMAVGVEMTPKNLSARLMLQSLKLAKSSLDRRFKLRIAEFATTIQDRYS